ncbi:MAG: hypothetical protein ACRDD1_15010, partial [Planctomycetia bacterium]
MTALPMGWRPAVRRAPSPFVVLLWCQLRRLRGLTLAAAGGMAVLTVGGSLFRVYERRTDLLAIDLPAIVPLVALVMTWFWAALLNVGVATVLFAGELDDGSAAALRERGRMGGAALAAKGAAWGIVNAAYGLFAFLLTTAATAAVGGWDHLAARLGPPTLDQAAPLLLGAACCLLASVTSRNAVGAVATAAFYFLGLTVPVLALEGNAGFRQMATSWQAWSPASPMAACFLAAAVVVGALAAVVACRWPEVPWLDDGFWPWAWKRTASPTVAEAPRFDALRRVVDRLCAYNATTRQFGVLVWQELRPAIGFVAVGFALLGAWLAVIRLLDLPATLFGFALLLWLSGAGIALLRSAVVGDGLRVVAERGVSAGLFLAAKTLVWLPIAVVGTAAAFGVGWLVLVPPNLESPPNQFSDPQFTLFTLQVEVVSIVLCQFVGAAFLYAVTRRLLIAAGLSLFLMVPQISWWWMVLSHDVPWWWAAAPIPFVLFAATYVYLAAWMKRDDGAWRPAGAFLAAWAALVGVGFATYRATAIPVLDVSAVLDAAPSPP